MKISKEVKALVSIEALAGEDIGPKQEAIDSFSNIYGEFDPTKAEFYYKNLLERAAVVSEIYTLAHVALPHSCKHPGWDKKLNSIFRFLTSKKANYVSKKTLTDPKYRRHTARVLNNKLNKVGK
jgi:hypothetical protein